MNDEIMVSVSCLVYNHAKYLRKCLDGFVMQKTNFKFEVLIHDDASTDGSQEIIREYERKYPDIIKPIYQTENQYSKPGVSILWRYQYTRIKGKYVAFCEGDDYWTDPNKLQIQFEIMERNPECSLCVHSVNCVSEEGNMLKEVMPSKKLTTGIYTSEEWLSLFLKNSKLIHTTSFFVRSEIISNCLNNIPEFIKISPVGDKTIVLLCAAYGNIYYIARYMSVYRLCSVGSWNERVKKFSEEKKKEIRNRSIRSLDEYNMFTNYLFNGLIEYSKGKYNFNELIIQKDYKKLFIKENKIYFNELPIKEKLYYLFYSIFSFLK